MSCGVVEYCGDDSDLGAWGGIVYYPNDPFDPCGSGLVCCPINPNVCFEVFGGSTFYGSEIGPAEEYGQDYCWYNVDCVFNQAWAGGNTTVENPVFHYAYAVALCGTYGLNGAGDGTINSSVNLLSSPDIALNKDFLATISPNPFTNNISISIYSNDSQGVKINVFNALGEEVTRLNSNLDARQNHKLEVSLPNSLSEGVYFVKITTSDNHTLVKKIIKTDF